MGSLGPIVIYKSLNCAQTRAIPIYIFVGSFTSLVSLGIVSVNFSTKICLFQMTFYWPISVYYEDTDAGGVVYHSNYLNFFERARTEWLKALGVSQTALLANDTAFVVKRAELDFRKAARFEQNLIVETKVIELKKASLVFHQRLVDHQGDCYCEGTVLVACVALSRMRPRAIPLNIVQEFDSAS